MRKVALAFKRLLRDRGADLAYARRLPDLLRAHGLRDIAGEGRMVFGTGGSPGVATGGGELLPGCRGDDPRELCTSGELRSALELLDDPSVGVATHLLISAWGRRPS